MANDPGSGIYDLFMIPMQQNATKKAYIYYIYIIIIIIIYIIYYIVRVCTYRVCLGEAHQPVVWVEVKRPACSTKQNTIFCRLSYWRFVCPEPVLASNRFSQLGKHGAEKRRRDSFFSLTSQVGSSLEKRGKTSSFLSNEYFAKTGSGQT